MLDAFIIEELRRREEQERKRSEHQPRVDLPVHEEEEPERDENNEHKKKPSRGVTIIDV